MHLFTIRLKSVLKVTLCIIFIVVMFLSPDAVSNAAKEGFNISLYLVLPSLFPFAVISSFICSNLALPTFITKLFSKLTGISEEGTSPFLMGLISGYPVGAILISDKFYGGTISKSEAEHLLPLANASGPLFLIGVAGVGMFGSVTIGYFLYFVHLASVIIMSVLIRRFAPQKSQSFSRKSAKLSLVQSVDKAMSSMINVMGCIAFFSVVSRIAEIMGIFKIFGSFSPLPYGVLEITNGLNRLAISDLPLRLKLSLASFLGGFSGICILMQVQNAVKETGISCFKYVIIKLSIGVLAFVITWALYPFLPVTVPTFSQSMPLSPNFLWASYGFILFLLPLYKILKNSASFFDKR